MPGDWLAAAWRLRRLVLAAVAAEFRARYARSRLGAAWMVLHPLAQVLIYALVLGAVFAARLPEVGHPQAYALYLLAGMAGWALFAEGVQRGLTLYVDNGPLLKKIAFPRALLPLNLAASCLVSHGLLLLATLAVFAALGHLAPAQLAWLPLLVALNLGAALGLGLTLGVLNVFLRDVGQAVPVLLQFAFWSVPVVYVPAVMPQRLQSWLTFNPLYHLITPYQQVLVYARPPEPASLAGAALLAAGLLALAAWLARRAGPDMVDAL